MEGLVLAIDQGTTGTRAVVYDEKTRVVGSSYREFSQHFPKPGWVEHDAEEIWRATQAVMKAAVKGRRIAAIGITNQRETTVLWDRVTGRPVRRAIVWQDRRTAPFCGALKKRGLERVVRAKTGLLLDPYFSASKIRWLLDADSGLRLKGLKVDGGATANGFLMQFQADLLGVPVQVSDAAESTAWGAAKLAGIGAGLWKTAQAADRRRKYRRVAPRMPRAKARALRKEWRGAVARLLHQ